MGSPAGLTQALHRFAMSRPDTEEGIACAGTSLEKRTIKVRNKAFLFLGAADAMLKLRESITAAAKFAADHPGSCKVGANGWVNISLDKDPTPGLDVLQKWIEESYSLFAPTKAAAKPTKKEPVSKKKSKSTKRA